jgi:hypothetical protein
LLVHFFGADDHFLFEQLGLDVLEAGEAPAGGGHGFDQILLGLVGGLEVCEVGLAEGFELGSVFVGQDHVFDGELGVGRRREAVAEAVLGGAGAAFGGDRAFGFGAVGSAARCFSDGCLTDM